MKRYALIERHDSDGIYTVTRCAESDSLSYINKRMEKLFLLARKDIQKDGKKPDSNFFVNEYARVGDKSWSIMDLQEEIDKEALEAEIDFAILKIPESPSNDELRELCRKFYEKGREKERKR